MSEQIKYKGKEGVFKTNEEVADKNLTDYLFIGLGIGLVLGFLGGYVIGYREGYNMAIEAVKTLYQLR